MTKTKKERLARERLIAQRASRALANALSEPDKLKSWDGFSPYSTFAAGVAAAMVKGEIGMVDDVRFIKSADFYKRDPESVLATTEDELAHALTYEPEPRMTVQNMKEIAATLQQYQPRAPFITYVHPSVEDDIRKLFA